MPLDQAYAEYLLRFAPGRRPVDTLADFVETLREHGTDTQYSDEDWIPFLLPFVDGDPDKARDLWDALLCQPSYVD